MWEDIFQKWIRRNFLVEISPPENVRTKPRGSSRKSSSRHLPVEIKMNSRNFLVDIEMTYLGKLIPGNSLVAWNVFGPDCNHEFPGKPNKRKGRNEKFMNFAHFCEFWCFSLGKQARFTLNFCSGMPLWKVHKKKKNLSLVWFAGATPDVNLEEILALVWWSLVERLVKGHLL